MSSLLTVLTTGVWNSQVNGTGYHPFRKEACGSPRRNGGSGEQRRGLDVHHACCFPHCCDKAHNRATSVRKGDGGSRRLLTWENSFPWVGEGLVQERAHITSVLVEQRGSIQCSVGFLGFSFFRSRTAASGMALTTLSLGFSLLMKAPWKYPQSCCQRCVSQVTSNLAKLTLKMNHPSSWFIDLLRKH